MKVFLQSHEETCRMDVETLPALLMNYQWSREQKWYRMVSVVTSRKTEIAEVCLRTKMTMVPYRGRTGEAAPRSEKLAI